MLAVPDLRTVDIPISARLLPEEERWKMGWFGRPGASDILEPEVERAWLDAN